ncbi:MAG: copper resistance protein CopC [Sphingomonadales bacterium]|nr:MAG: copper resistance protein CopC [Sphingomonadales bacterium]
MRSYLLAAATALMFAAAPAVAHPKLLSASPAPNATVAPAARVQLTFSEVLVPKLSGAEVLMTGMPGMAAHAPAKMDAKLSLAADRKTLILTFAKPLPKGSYRLDWYVVSADTHRVKGSYVFVVA